MQIEKGGAGVITREQVEKDIEELKSAGGQPPFVLLKHPALYVEDVDDLPSSVRIVDNSRLPNFEYYIQAMNGVEDNNG